MKSVTAACFDVYYYNNHAKAGCIVFEKAERERILSSYSEIINRVQEYIPGQFYKRELPCLLAVLEKVNENVDFIIVDSFVWLSDDKKGLGAYLYEALGSSIPVIGVAKSYFKDVKIYKEVYRGESNKPLFISSAGIDLDFAAEFIKSLEGEYKLPKVLKEVDKLSRSWFSK